MKRTRVTEEQIIGVLKEAEAGAKTATGPAVKVRFPQVPLAELNMHPQ